jgi:hypothetical protein
MQFAQCFLSANAYSIAGGMCSEPFRHILISRSFQIYGCLFRIGFALPMTMNSMPVGLRSRGTLRSPRALPNISPEDWLPQKEMWSVMSCQNRTIFEEGNTNMLLESYVIALINIYIFPNVLFLMCYQISPYAKEHMA